MLERPGLGGVRWGAGQGNLALSSDYKITGDCEASASISLTRPAPVITFVSSGWGHGCSDLSGRMAAAAHTTCLQSDSRQDKSCVVPLWEEGERRPGRTECAGSASGSPGSSHPVFLQLAAVQTGRKEKLLFSYKISKSIKKHRKKGSLP